MWLRWAILTLPGLLLFALGACTDDDPPGVASAGGDEAAVDPARPADRAGDRERQFISCMRGAGIEMSDPIPGDTSGRGALKHEIEVNGQGGNPKFQDALEKCEAYLPGPAGPEPVAPDELAHLRGFAQCMRDNGVTDYPDPGPGDPTRPYWLRAGDPVALAAIQKCQRLLPSGPGPAGGAGR